MSVTIESLPCELLSCILHEAAQLNAKDGCSFSYGITQAPQPMQDVRRPQKYISGFVPPDVLRWNTTSSIRQVNRRWHDWAIRYSFKELYIRRWRGSERWLDAPRLADPKAAVSGTVVYQDPFRSLRLTAELFAHYPHLAWAVRRLWFDNFCVAETDAYILGIFRLCKGLSSAAVPWTVLRCASEAEWSGILSSTAPVPLSSLELRLTSRKVSHSKETDAVTCISPLKSPLINLCRLTRLKLVGDTDWPAVTDGDLEDIARTANNLEEIHITGVSTVSVQGVLALAHASKHTLRILEYWPANRRGNVLTLHIDEFNSVSLCPENNSHVSRLPHPSGQCNSDTSQPHICHQLRQLTRLEDLSITLPTVCHELFCPSGLDHGFNPFAWFGVSKDILIRANGFCGEVQTQSHDCGILAELSHTQDQASTKNDEKKPLDQLIKAARSFVEMRQWRYPVTGEWRGICSGSSGTLALGVEASLC